MDVEDHAHCDSSPRLLPIGLRIWLKSEAVEVIGKVSCVDHSE